MATVKRLEFYRGETKRFTEDAIKLGGQLQDVSADVVRLIIKRNRSDTDANKILLKSGDSATDGANGNVAFELTATETNIAEGSYHGEITWLPTGAEHVVRQLLVVCKERVEDVPGT